MIDWLFGAILSIVSFLWDLIVRFAKERPYAACLIAWGIVRSFGVVVRSGQAGVLFRFGRAIKVLDAGFHPLLPVVHAVRKMPIRSITLDLPRQRVTTADGLVFDADTSIVFHVEAPIKAVTLVDNVTQAIGNIVPMLVQNLIREQTRDDLANRQQLDAELIVRVQQRLAGWGVAVEQAGFSSIAPTRHTTRLTQLRSRVLERRRLMELAAEGRPEAVAVLLTAAGPAPVGHSAHRYRRHRMKRQLIRRFRQRVDAAILELAALAEAQGQPPPVVVTATAPGAPGSGPGRA